MTRRIPMVLRRDANVEIRPETDMQVPHVMAKYREQEISYYQGNPYIESLPGIIGDIETFNRLKFLPQTDPNSRFLPSHLRYHLIYNLNQFFRPLTIHLVLAMKLSILIRSGYLGRNPLHKHYDRHMEKGLAQANYRKSRKGYFRSNLYSHRPKKIRSFLKWMREKNWLIYCYFEKAKNRLRSTATGFYIVGLSGVGKSTTIETILSVLYDQVIEHHNYKGRRFIRTQIVWVKINCPPDASLKALCYEFFIEVDRLLGGHKYEDLYCKGKEDKLDRLIMHIRIVSRKHGIGLLVVDEIHNLDVAKSQGSTMMLNFFVSLVNSSGMPVVLIGTPKALPYLTAELQQCRRACGVGDLKWPLFTRNDPEWKLFVKTLLAYQFTMETVDIDDKDKVNSIADALYDASAGIFDFAIKAYILVQFRAVQSEIYLGSKKNEPVYKQIFPDLFEWVAQNEFAFAWPIINNLTKGLYENLEDVPDIKQFNLKEFFENFLNDRRADLLKIVSETNDVKSPSATEELALAEKPRLVNSPTSSKSANNSTILNPHKPKRPKKPKAEKVEEKFNEGDLRLLFDKSQATGVPILDLLRMNGYLRSAEEFLLL